ncbi:hypothetical protein [Nostoc sp. TCL26-01]|uniref:DUF7660 family protein n=1 Tax=Nostoc sp. TCL26-01 TaxID=2576904 RepID=UPI0015C04E12|nr:hypothetical protein [Nostoc sp. TCL26-01]QLE58429.1 hypothetical protein FD725_24680 [Nostoc sp. TCL26-01]
MEEHTVSSRQELAQYIRAMREDLLANPDEWENITLDSYLEALAAYVQDINNLSKNIQIQLDTEQPSWQLFADLLAGAAIYE